VTRSYFDAVSKDWDAMRQGFFPDDLAREAADAMDVRAGLRYLDVGAGTGFISAEILSRGARPVAIDASPRMVEALRARFPGVEAREADAEHLPFPDASFDGAFSNMCLHHVEHPAAMVREMARVVRPGGRLVITDLDTHTHEFLRMEHRDRWMGFERAEVQAWLEGAGLVKAAVGCSASTCCAQNSSKTERAKVSIFLATGTVPRMAG
jgi:ubiquinone/menaquinone biosynthesis C-methylase UbiE